MGCMTEDYKTILVELVAKNVPHDVLKYVVNSIPICPIGGPAVSAVKKAAESKRGVPERWPEPDYIDAEGKRTHFSSISALIDKLGFKMSGTQVVCNIETGVEEKCKAASSVEILRLQGYTVEGDGEPTKLSEGGKVLTVIHPDYIKKGSSATTGAGPLGGAFGLLKEG